MSPRALLALILGAGCSLETPIPGGDDAGVDPGGAPDARVDDAGEPTADAGPDGFDEPVARTPVINEFVINITGSDTHEYVEIFADPNTDLSAMAIVAIESSVFQDPGRIELALPIGTTDETGHYVTPYQNAMFQNTSMTLALVDGFTGSPGDDTDADDDGMFDDPPWTAVVDAVALDDGGGNDVFHAAMRLPPNPGIWSGASRFPNGTATGAVSDWVVNDVDGAGLPCGQCAGQIAESGEAQNTPGAGNSIAE